MICAAQPYRRGFDDYLFQTKNYTNTRQCMRHVVRPTLRMFVYIDHANADTTTCINNICMFKTEETQCRAL